MAKVGEILRFGDKGMSADEARKQMLEAGEAPTGILSEVRKNIAVGVAQTPTADVAPPEPEPVPAPAPEPAPQVAAPEAPASERIENSKFVLEIRQENGQWVAEIEYKNGAGIERFEAPTRKLLDMRLLEGKAHATLRVREAIRREKYGLEIDNEYPLPEEVTLEQFETQPQSQQNAWIVSQAKLAAISFRENHPEFYFCDENAEKVMKFLGYKKLPVTEKNLEYAFAELADVDELVPKPQPQVNVPAPQSTTPAVDSAARAALVDTPTPTAAPATAEAVVALVPVVRKRGSTGLKPGDSTASPAAVSQEEGLEPREPSEAELRKLSPVQGGDPRNSPLASEYKKFMATRRVNRQF